MKEVGVADGVCELGDGYFKGCKSLRCVNFGSSSSVERIGVPWFEDTEMMACETCEHPRQCS